MRVSTPIGRLPASVVIAGNILFWPGWTAVVGYAAQRTPDGHFTDDDAITRARPGERGGAWYRDVAKIDSWKTRLPEAGGAFGGFQKRTLSSSDPEVLERFIVETRRAEHAHWAMAAGGVLTLLWNPWWAAPANVAVAAGSNLPCVAVQRYNRARLRRVLAAVRRRPTSSR